MPARGGFILLLGLDHALPKVDPLKDTVERTARGRPRPPQARGPAGLAHRPRARVPAAVSPSKVVP
jgi:hypothetical protein